ncbi:TPA: glycosyltransferase [Vibrio vulnificus]|uniref:glycosyltransferase family 4 protein n=1 Tax=Vibrio vulnificus TaxID=672 RepID=UPI001A32C00C|nr:glycosyltransferase [Vibrio vulnificus]HAS6107683.1 glycosyltransferase [Vibrio vulnificus]
MRILHICLSNFYIDDVSYQENMLVKEHVEAGHEVKILASTQVFDKDKKLTYVKPSTYTCAEGAEITRIDYLNILPRKLMAKLRIHSGVYDFIRSFEPEVIMFHSMCGWELLTVCKYIKNNPNIRVYFDSHEDFNNSARNFASKYLLHYLYYRPIAKIASKYAKKILCISLETMDFLSDFYGLDIDRLEFYPLGGVIKSEQAYLASRQKVRESLQVKDEQIVFIQSGKFTARKKLIESLTAFTKVRDDNFVFLIAGILDTPLENEALKLIRSDCRIRFLGWQSPADVDGLLDAADVYLQPGTQSVTMQASLCARCAVIIDDVKSHKPYLENNGWYANNADSIVEVLMSISEQKCSISSMSEESFKIAKSLLDYKQLALRILN